MPEAASALSIAASSSVLLKAPSIAVETFPDIFRTLGNVTMDVAVTGVAAGKRSEN